LVQLTKTKICQLNRRGVCHDESCRFAHSPEELRSRPNLMKTSICRAFQKGKCREENCKFAHGEAELRVTDTVYKTQLCVFHARGFCKKGNRCRHAHGHQELQQNITAQQQQWAQQEKVQPLQEHWSQHASLATTDEEPLLKSVPEPGKNAAAAPWTPPPAMMKTPTHSVVKTPSTVGPLSFHSSMASLGSPPSPWELAEPQYVPLPADLCFDCGPQFGGLEDDNIFTQPFSFSNSNALKAILTEKLTHFEDEGLNHVSEAGLFPKGLTVSALGSVSSPIGSVASPAATVQENVPPSTPPRTPRQVLPSASPMREAIETSLASIMDSPTPWHPTSLRFEALSA